jgi:outer membrane biosynthesis protein TonB
MIVSGTIPVHFDYINHEILEAIFLSVQTKNKTMSLEESNVRLAKAIERLADILEAKGQMPLPLSTPPPAAAVTTPAPEATPTPPAETKVEVKEEKKAKVEKTPKAEKTEKPEVNGATPPPPESVTLSDLRALGKKAIEAGKAAGMRQLIEANGAESLTTLEPEKYGVVLVGLQKLLT